MSHAGADWLSCGWMRMVVTVLALGVVAGCATVPQLTAADLDAEARGNMLGAQQKFAGKMLVVRGVVKQTTLATRERVEISRGWSAGPASAVNREEQVPLVVLQPGSVLCYFEPEAIGDAASLHEGDAVALECQLQYFKQMETLAVSTLAGCRAFK